MKTESENSFEAKFENSWNWVEERIGAQKFAVIIILIFTLLMIIGTFLESYYGTEFAGKVVYKTPYFMGVQLLMFLSILLATFRRLPPVKRLYGFYTIHTGLILIGIGSFVTFLAGVDGSILLPPFTPSRTVILDDDILKINLIDEKVDATLKLPKTAFEQKYEADFGKIKVKRYLPYSEKVFTWKKTSKTYKDTDYIHSSQYSISNPMVSESFWLSLHPEADGFDSNKTLGPLSVFYMPEKLMPCFNSNSKSKLIIWHRVKGICFTPEDRNISIQKTKPGKRFLVVKEDGKVFSFFPEYSPWPMDEKLKIIQNSPMRIFNQKLFEARPSLFLFGKHISFYSKDEKKWETNTFSNNEPVILPWMGFEVRLLEHSERKIPYLKPEYTLPIQKNGAIVKGRDKAVELDVNGESYWVTNSAPLSLLIDGKRVVIQLIKSSLTLPFEFILEKFKMDKNPGTNSPASYESFVKLFTTDGSENHHIFMNNPLKYNGFTFYQASYQQDTKGNYSSTLSANMDPGRPIKYLGSILLILGAIWHYRLNYRKKGKLNSPLIKGLEEEV